MRDKADVYPMVSPCFSLWPLLLSSLYPLPCFTLLDPGSSSIRDMPAALVSPTTPSPSAYRVDDQSLCSTPMQYAANADGIPSPASTVRPKDTPRLRKTQQREVASDFLALHAQGRAHTHAFRVHSPVSAPNSTLIWSGYPATSGFFPYNEHLAITPAVYLSTIVPGTAESRTTGRRYGHEGRVGAITATVWEHGPYVRHTMVDHINGKMRQGLLNIPSRLEERPGTPEDEKSPWVSGTRSVMWAIWEVARRLAWGEEAVGLTVIRCEPAAEVIQQESSNGLENGEAGTSESELESWRRAEDTRRRSYIGREVLINPLKPIAAALASGRGGGSMSVSMREAYELALRSARESEEVLWYGRVFAESIARNLDFTCHVSQISCKPESMIQLISGGSSHRVTSTVLAVSVFPVRSARQTISFWSS